MNTKQIEYLLKNDPYSQKMFKKVCAKDLIPRVTYPTAYVVNSHPSSKPGEHWVAMYFDKNGKGEYFDSYGLSPDIFGFTEFMNKNSTSWDFNKKTLQSLFSNVCGHYCIYFILFRCRGVSMRDITAHFSSNLTENDRRVANFIKDLF